MPRRDYTQEIGLASPKKTFPRPVAYAILAVIAGVVGFGVKEVMVKTDQHHAAEKAAVAPAPGGN